MEQWKYFITAYGCGDGTKIESLPRELETGQLLLVKKTLNLGSLPEAKSWKQVFLIDGGKIVVTMQDGRYDFQAFSNSVAEIVLVMMRFNCQVEVILRVMEIMDDFGWTQVDACVEPMLRHLAKMIPVKLFKE